MISHASLEVIVTGSGMSQHRHNQFLRRGNSSPWNHVVYLLIFCAITISSSGCSRSFWRQQADDETYRLLARKMNDRRWVLPRMDVTPELNSRLFDPYDPDTPPLPPDDPAAHQYMHHMSYEGFMEGYDSWHDFGQTFSVENPNWLGQFGLTPDQLCPPEERSGSAVPTLNNMTLTQALELASINSREYQTEIENLYLAALDLTFERFRFNIRYLGFGGEPSTDLEYESIPDGRNSLRSSSRFGVSQLLPSGAQWVVELANNTLWIFSGENSTSTSSVISYSLVQPLLQGAGRQVTLENLTLQERVVLYQTRDLARFRKTFFTDIVSSYLNLLQTIQSIANLENNIDLLEDQLERLRAESELREISRFTVRLVELEPNLIFPPEVAEQIDYDERQRILIWKGEMSAEQMKILRSISENAMFNSAVADLIQQQTADQTSLELIQLESRFVSSQNSLRQSKQNYQTALDQFKLVLGLPTDFQITIDESLIAPFQLIDKLLSGTTQELKDSLGLIPDPSQVATIDEFITVAEQFEQKLLRAQEETIRLVEADSEKVQSLIAQRKQAANSDPETFERLEQDVERDMRLLEDEKANFEIESTRLSELKAQLIEYQNNNSLTPELTNQLYEQLTSIREQLIRISQSLQVLQIGFRVELIELEAFNMTMEQAVAYALENRLDLMNTRARVMDARRRMEVFANDLEGVLDVRAEGDIRTPVGTRPFDFRGAESSYRVGIGFTAPLDQIDERNNYRAALIAYQQAKRAYIDLEDRVKQQVRQSHRNLTVLRENFETARQSVRINARQYDITVELANSRNPAPNQGLNILNALDSVLSAQNQLIGIWVNYETNRLNIHQDMGMMDIDERGVWRDPFYQGRSNASRSLAPRQSNHILAPRLVHQKPVRTPEKFAGYDLKLVPAPAASPPTSRRVGGDLPPVPEILPVTAVVSSNLTNYSIDSNWQARQQPDERSSPSAPLPTIRPSATNTISAEPTELNESQHDQNTGLQPDPPATGGGRDLGLQRLDEHGPDSGWRAHHARR
ncbi:MAG: TolC family protein [Planctomycetaceae bacterium]